MVLEDKLEHDDRGLGMLDDDIQRKVLLFVVALFVLIGEIWSVTEKELVLILWLFLKI